jgi:PAS domain S-box-containing protein
MKLRRDHQIQYLSEVFLTVLSADPDSTLIPLLNIAAIVTRWLSGARRHCLLSGVSMTDDPRLELALKAASIGIWDWDLINNRFDYSDRARAIYGFAPTGDITIEMVRGVTHPDDLPYTSAQAKRAIDPELREDNPYEYRIIRADTGELRWVRAEGHAEFKAIAGAMKPIRYIGCVQDITETKRAVTALEESERRQRLALEAADMAVWEFDLTSNTLVNSGDMKRLFGFRESDEVSVEDYRERYLPGERDRMQQVAMAALAADEYHFELEFRIMRLDNQERWLLLRAEILMSEGQPHRVVGILMDIDDRKRNAERQLLLMRELNHRVKNSLSVVQSIAGQTFKVGDVAAESLEAFRRRLRALADANDILVQSEWSSFDLDALISKIISPYRSECMNPFIVSGSQINIPPRLNVPLALALHELATNAAKYGALAAPEGKVRIDCRHEGETASIEWAELNGSADAADKGGGGFGIKLLTKILAAEFQTIEHQLRPDGAWCRIEVRL